MDIWPSLLQNTHYWPNCFSVDVGKGTIRLCCAGSGAVMQCIVCRYASAVREVGAVMQCIVYTRVVLNSFQIFAQDRVELLLSCKLELFKIIFCQIHV